MIRVLVVDDQPMIRLGIRSILDAQDDMTVVGDAENGSTAVETARALVPDVVLMDVRVIAGGEALLAPSITRRLIEQFVESRPRRTSGTAQLSALTDREREVLVLIARGLSNLEIARALFIAEQTTKTHVSRILQKLGLRDRVQAVVLGYESGLVSPGHG